VKAGPNDPHRASSYRRYLASSVHYSTLTVTVSTEVPANSVQSLADTGTGHRVRNLSAHEGLKRNISASAFELPAREALIRPSPSVDHMSREVRNSPRLLGSNAFVLAWTPALQKPGPAARPRPASCTAPTIRRHPSLSPPADVAAA